MVRSFKIVPVSEILILLSLASLHVTLRIYHTAFIFLIGLLSELMDESRVLKNWIYFHDAGVCLCMVFFGQTFLIIYPHFKSLIVLWNAPLNLLLFVNVKLLLKNRSFSFKPFLCKLGLNPPLPMNSITHL